MHGCMGAVVVYGFCEASHDAILDATALATLQIDEFALSTVRGHVDVPVYGRTCTLTDGACQLPSPDRDAVDAAFAWYCQFLGRAEYDSPDGDAVVAPRFVVCVCGQYDSHERRRYDIE